MLQHNLLDRTTVISGIGRSGTTFLALVFHNAGYDLQTNPDHIGINIPNGGMEISQVAKLSRSMGTELIYYPKIIKDPSFAHNLHKWLEIGQRPKHIIFLARDMGACSDSHNASGVTVDKYITQEYWYKGLRNAITNGIPVTIVPFPEIATNPALSELLAPWIKDPWTIIQQTYDQNKVHY